jgi:glycosyltransferase involved in cell wall biosynthesis
MKLACVVHRFGADLAGGSESHCRLLADHLSTSHEVTIVTTCARDHVTWRNHYPAGESQVGRLRLVRFPVARTRNMARFQEISDHVFTGRATAAEEEQWFRENGPDAPALIEYLGRRASQFDLVIFWAYRYYHSYFGLPLVGRRAVLVPTAEADPLVYVEAARRLFALPSGFLFLTPEEAALVGTCVPVGRPALVVGAGIDAPNGAACAGSLRARGVTDPYMLYLGRIDPNKGCQTLLRYFIRYVDERVDEGPAGRVQAPISLVMAGPANMPIPDHPRIQRLGFVDEATREALLGGARMLVAPSPFESLSMALLEAWNHRVPALVNGRCAVLKGQVERADGGLYYRTPGEFAAALDYLLDHPDVAQRLGRQGHAYVEREYRWPTVMARVEAFLDTVRRS